MSGDSSSAFSQTHSPGLLWHNPLTGQTLLWHLQEGAAVESTALPIVKASDWQMASAGDFDGNGTSELLWRDYATGRNVLWFLDATGTRVAQRREINRVDDLAAKPTGFGDFNGDGKDDIIWRYGNGQNEAWYMNGATVTSTEGGQSAPNLNLEMVGAGDFAGDEPGRILWRDRVDGDTSILDLEGRYLSSSGFSVFQRTDPAWKIEGTDDFNQDGKTDILWRYYGEGERQGETEIWYMDGRRRVGTQSLLKISGLNWQATPVNLPRLPQSPPPSAITVNYPTTGTSVASGKSRNIVWKDSIDGNVKIELYQGSQQQQTIISSTPSDGLHSWFVSSSLAQGGNYRIRVSSIDNPAVEAYSNPFTIEAPSIQLLGLNQGQPLQAGGTYTVNWRSNTGTIAALDLYQAGQKVETINSSLIDDGHYNWTVPSQLALGSDYTLRIEERFSNSTFDTSDVSFSVFAKPDIDIQLFDPTNAFTPTQWRAFNDAAEKWERLITNDKDSSGVFRISVTQADLGSSFFSQTLAEAVQDDAKNRRTNFSVVQGQTVDINGVDYDNNVTWNSRAIGDQDYKGLVTIMMHELGHALGLDHESRETDSLMYFRYDEEEANRLTDETLGTLEELGYRLNRTTVAVINSELKALVA